MTLVEVLVAVGAAVGTAAGAFAAGRSRKPEEPARATATPPPPDPVVAELRATVAELTAARDAKIAETAERAAVRAFTRIMERAGQVRAQNKKEPTDGSRASEDPDTDPRG